MGTIRAIVYAALAWIVIGLGACVAYAEVLYTPVSAIRWLTGANHVTVSGLYYETALEACDDATLRAATETYMLEQCAANSWTCTTPLGAAYLDEIPNADPVVAAGEGCWYDMQDGDQWGAWAGGRVVGEEQSEPPPGGDGVTLDTPLSDVDVRLVAVLLGAFGLFVFAFAVGLRR